MSDPLDRVDFARRVLGLEPFDYQVPALRSTAPYVVIRGGRRSGKTVTAQIAALHTTFTHRNAEALVTGPNEANVRERISETASLIAASDLAREATVDEGAMQITFRNGSRIVGLVPTPGNLRGRGRSVFMVWIDEPGHVADSVWRDVRYTLLDNLEAGAQAWLTGTPWGEGFFKLAWRRAQDGDPDYAAFGPWRSAMNPRLPREWIERERARLNSLEAAAELDGEDQEDGMRLFPPSLLDENKAPSLELPAWSEVRPPVRPVVSLDVGLQYDQSASCLLARVPGVAAANPERPPRPVFTVISRVWPLGTRLGEVVDDVVNLDCRPWAYALETVGMGARPAEEVHERVTATDPGTRPRPGWCLIHTTQATKLSSYGLVRWLLERHQLLLPPEPVLLRQLAGVRMERRAQGTRIEAEDPSVHDDVADALSFCMLPVSGARGVFCDLGRLAGGKDTLPDVDVRPAEEWAETGSGLKVPRRPVLQSVNGLEASAHIDERPAPPPPAGRESEIPEMRAAPAVRTMPTKRRRPPGRRIR